MMLHSLHAFPRPFAGLLLCASLAAATPGYGQTMMPASPTQGRISLEDTVRSTLLTHKTLKVSQEGRVALVYDRASARAGYGPRIDISAGAGYSQTQSSEDTPAHDGDALAAVGNAGVVVAQPVYDGFATRSRVRSAQASLDSASLRVYNTATDLAMAAIAAHINVIQRREEVVLAEENVTRHQTVLLQTKDRERGGVETMADVTQAETRLARAHSTLVEARTALLDVEANYRRLTGKAPGGDLAPVELPGNLYAGNSDVLRDAMTYNPLLAAFIKDIMVARANKQLADAAFHPVINLQLSANYSDRDAKDAPWSYNANAAANASWNLYSHGMDTAGANAAAARVRQARQAMYSYMDDMVLQVNTTWNAYISSQEQFKHYSDAIRANTITRDAYQEQFLIGKRDLLDVLGANSELFSSSTQASQSRGALLQSSYRLLALSGTLLPSLRVDTASLYETPPPPLAEVR